jgi:hypothetical protein
MLSLGERYVRGRSCVNVQLLVQGKCELYGTALISNIASFHLVTYKYVSLFQTLFRAISRMTVD